MPITIFPSPAKTGKNIDKPVTSSCNLLTISPTYTIDRHRLLRHLNPLLPDPRPILSSSLSDLDAQNPPSVIAYSNALVISIIRAF
jgi:hypothetical protein